MHKALIIDDERPVQIAISKLGHWSKYGVEMPVYAGNGKEGLVAMREIRPDIVFVDMEMPIMNGCDFLEKAGKEFPNSQYIVVSGYDEFQYAQQALRFGACDYLLKPVEEESLNKSIEKALLKINPNLSFNDKATPSTNMVSPEEVIEIIKEYVESNYCTNIKLSMFADQYFFSQEYLNKLFKNKYHFTIYEYMLKLRMQRARELLEQPDYKIMAIAERLGYSDNHYFSKAFRTYYGLTPSAYRNQFFKN